MRWDNLTTAADEAARLPGHRDPATIRRFDAPEALDMRFYEIHAKSAINRVPNASQMPFRWTINPYRGCSPCVPVLLRPPHAQVPGLRRGPRLRARDRREGQRAGGRAGGAATAVVEGRARRDGDEHRSVPVGRVALQAHAGDLGGVSRRAQPVLDPHEVAAAAARHRAHEGDRGGHARSTRTSRSRRSTRRRGARPSRTRRIRARGWRRSRSSTGRGSRRAC